VSVKASRSRRLRSSLDRGQRRTLLMMLAAVASLHVIGFLMLFSLIAPRRYQIGPTGAFTIGIGLRTRLGCGMRSMPITSRRSTIRPGS
jgi:hypothetical protein